MKSQRVGRGQEGDGATLLEIVELRSGVAYRAAEILRQRLGATAMASYPVTSDEHAGVRLLVGTWDAIASMVRAGDVDKQRFFETNPVGLMWDSLDGAIRALRRSKELGSEYGRDFERLAADYRRWTRTPAGRKYRSPSAQAIHAHFG